MNKKKILVLAMTLSMVAILALGATLAYFTDTEKVENVFTVGNVDIQLDEPNWNGEEGTGVAEGVEAYPGEALAKDPTVTNVGPNPCFVRVKVEGLDQFGEEAMIGLRYIDENGVYHEGYNTEDWTLIDGYYYYNHVLAAEEAAGTEYNEELVEVTGPVFSQIVMPTSIENSAETEPIVVTAEAVQAQGARASYSAVKAMTPAEIAAWFGTAFDAAE